MAIQALEMVEMAVQKKNTIFKSCIPLKWLFLVEN